MAAMPTFADRLQQKIREHSPLCVGIDPSAAVLKACGLPDSPEGALEFGQRVLDAADYRIAVLKPQSAFFERFGSAGFLALEALVKLARAREVPVLLDGKRGDIDTTAAAYAEGYFSATTTLRVDAITTHCYLGLAALEPFFAAAIAADGGVFVVVRSSNPEGQGLQTARMANGETVAQNLCREITARNLRQRKDADETAAAMPNSFVLAPGVGAQGATMRDVLARMPSGRGRVLPNVSRAILANGSRRDDIRMTIAVLQDQARELL
jgi:orotidine-5'-phosphate decarboxylase